MESKTNITRKTDVIEQGYYVKLECCMCTNEEMFAANSLDDLEKDISESEWVNLDSDVFGLTGHWCGCDYID